MPVDSLEILDGPSGPRGRRFESCLPDSKKGPESLRKFLGCSGPFDVFRKVGDTGGDTASVHGPEFGRVRHALELEPIHLGAQVVRGQMAVDRLRELRGAVAQDLLDHDQRNA